MKASIVLRNDVAELERLSDFVSAFCEVQRLPAEFDMVLNLVAEEVFTNVVRHGFEDSAPHEIEVGLGQDYRGVTIQVEDDARPFNPLQAPEFDPATPLDQRRGGGLGIHLLRKLMTDLQYDRVDGKNRLRLRKNFA